MIRLRDVSFGFPARAARNAISSANLTIEDGQWVAVAGGNGSGKTTLCRLVAGLCRPASGTVEVDGENPARSRSDDVQGVARSGHASIGAWDVPAVGIAFQNPDSQFVTSTVEREILFGMENLGLPADELESRFSAAGAMFGLDRYRARNPHSLSGGEKQRLLLACLWTMAPRHLILDEPFSFLDREARASFLEVLRRSFKSEGKTILWSTVDRRELAFADRVIYLNKGTIVFDGLPGELAPALSPDLLDVSPVSSAPDKAFGAGRSPLEPSAGRGSLIEIRDASFSRTEGDFVLEVPSFSVASGDSIGICGPSGSGKTTFLLGCAGLLPPRTGEVVLFGKRTSSRRDFPAGRLAYLFQTPEEAFFAPTVREEVALAHESLVHGPGEESAVSRALEEVGLDPGAFLDRSPFHLSQGEKRLVALASVLVLEASVFILDEPTIFLDGAAARRLHAALERIGSRGASIVVASHDGSFLETAARRVVALENGRLSSFFRI